MSDNMSVRTMVIHDCSGIEVEVDHTNGCVTICCNGSGKFAPKFVVTIFSPDDAPPELAPVTYVDPPQDEEKTLEYADKHGA